MRHGAGGGTGGAAAAGGPLAEQLARAGAATADALRAAGSEPDSLGELVPAHRRLLLRRPAILRSIGAAWRLGPLLVDTGGAIWAAGRTTRAAPRGRPGYQSLSREARREIAAAALRGGHGPGRTVHFDAAPLPGDDDAIRALPQTHPLGVWEEEVRVRWQPGASLSHAPALADFLDERLRLRLGSP